jgi:DNA-binding IclR family transcriptional regulator
MLQLEGELSVSQAADRLGVARSTAHRLLQMLVYRDFAATTETRTYRPGPVLELAAHSRSTTARLRAAALPHLHELVNVLGESANLVIRTGDQARFIGRACPLSPEFRGVAGDGAAGIGAAVGAAQAGAHTLLIERAPASPCPCAASGTTPTGSAPSSPPSASPPAP